MRKILAILSATLIGLLGCGGEEKANFKVSGQQFIAVDFSKDGSILAGIGKDGAINFWDPIKQKQILVVSAGDKRPTTLAFNPDGKTLALGHLDGDIRLIKTDDGEELQTVKTGNGQIKSMSFSGDGKYLALARKSSLEILPSSSFKKSQSFNCPSAIDAVTWTVDGKTVLAGCSDNNIYLFSLDGGKRLALKGHKKAVSAVCYSREGKMLASADRSGRIRIWPNPEKSQDSKEINAHAGAVTSISISPDGETIASSGTDNLVKTWDSKSGENLQIFKGHKNDVRGVAFAPDGKTVGSAGLDGTIKLWEIK